ncbi:hypothetical protein BJY21_000461 [Kineosphaera limosa]|uniref:Uncharacterized protein n=1 Tax=Kineosphaera limosa NBRC 100340 TaxID=1184609 RepID=K6XE08_9MICO|nr:hypothetical protein [Kineosphaera limosa]NYD99276.1 hypothetical protein [Kineosphaera limosa]GAB97074.1 hypothetical protein KILIM_055_00420 [Kineosphaera limosa NBRC 100340]
MRVTFTRTGERRYGVDIERTQAGDLRMHPAPGFDPLLPHDLVHFVVEVEFGLRDGIFGQVAAGGDANTFVPTQEQRTKAWARRAERRNRATGTQIGRSEELAAQVFPRWLRRRGHRPSPHYPHTDPPPSDLPEPDLERCFARLDDLSAAWQALEVGQSMSVTWPWPERPTRGGW